MGGLVFLLIFGIMLIAAPITCAVLGHPLGGVPTTILLGAGLVFTILAAVVLTITKLYVKTKASEAFVRTGMGGPKVIMDGGALVIPVVHQMVRISLQTFKLEVSREGPAALITEDMLRADIKAEFFIRVPPEIESIKSAARSFGEKMGDTATVTKIVEDKLVSALRTVAATRTLASLNTKRDEFLGEVQRIVAKDLSHNGLTLETATISKLDQADPATLKDNNIFDAQGLRTIAETTQNQLTARNALTRQGEQARKQQDVETQMKVLELDRKQAEALAAQQAEIAKVQAEQTRQSQEKQIETARAVDLANVAKAQAIEVAKREQQKAIEVAERQKQEAIARAEQERTAAEAALADAEAGREKARQTVKTVEVEAEAERDKKKQVINAQANAEQKYVEAMRAADASAYKLEKEAGAKKAAADAEAEAVTKKANAEAAAKKAQAEGERALALVPVEVANKKVEVEKRRVEEVLKPELEAREAHGQAAQSFELEQLRISKEAEVRIASANATVQLLNKVDAQVFGTPEDVAKMLGHFRSGMGISRTVDGALAGASDQTVALATGVFSKLEQLVGAIAERVGVKPEAAPAAPELPPPAKAKKPDGNGTQP